MGWADLHHTGFLLVGAISPVVLFSASAAADRKESRLAEISEETVISKRVNSLGRAVSNSTPLLTPLREDPEKVGDEKENPEKKLLQQS